MTEVPLLGIVRGWHIHDQASIQGDAGRPGISHNTINIRCQIQFTGEVTLQAARQRLSTSVIKVADVGARFIVMPEFVY